MTTPRRLPTIAAYAMPAEGDWPASRADWSLDPARCALLVHDMQAYFLDAFPAQGSPREPLIANVAALVTACRKAGIPVIYTAQNGEQDPRDRGLQGDLWGPGMRPVPEHEAVAEAVAPAPGDHVLVKHRYSAFQRSNLATLLRARGRNQLLICGVYAHIGCQATAFEAFQRDIHPFLIADAVADFSRDWHDAALRIVADCSGVVLPTAQVLETIK